MAFKNLIEWLSVPLRADAANYHRQLLLFETEDARQSIEALADALSSELSCAVVSDEMHYCATANVHPFVLSDYKKVLGQEFDIGIYNALCGLRPSAILALAGTLRFGGRLIILCPPLKEWPFHTGVTQPHYLSHGYSINESLFTRLIIEKFDRDCSVAICSKDKGVERLPIKYVTTTQRCYSDSENYLTVSQQRVMDDYLSSLDTDKSLYALTAPRGRGKSALLGTIAAALVNRSFKILLVSSRAHSQTVFYRHLANALSCKIHDAKEFVEWLAPDNPRAYNNDADIMLIDEAASLPLPVLTSLTARNSKCFVTTTTFGFEGSGLGFIHKFLLPRKASGQLRHLTLTEPVRWAANDPLESVLDNSLLFTNVQNELEAYAGPVTFSHLTARQTDPGLLSRLYHLLSDSHYQTSPDDLMRLTDAPDVCFILAFQGKLLVGAAVINHEGGNRLSSLSESIAQGNRRVKGHLSAQSIALLTVDADLARRSYLRINRIAVRDDHRRNGIASSMLNYIEAEAKKIQIDWLTSSYASDPKIDNFWKNADFKLIRRGKKPDKASGQISNLIIKPVSTFAKEKQNHLTNMYHFDTAESVEEMKRIVNHFALGTIIDSRIRAYINEHRSRELTGNAFIYFISTNVSLLSEDSLAYQFVINKCCIEDLIALNKLTGKKAFERKLLEETKTVYRTPDNE